MVSDVVIIGAGTIGSVFSVLLHEKGYNVSVVDLENRINNIKKDGIKIRGNKNFDVLVSERFQAYTTDQINDVKIKDTGIVMIGVKTPYMHNVIDNLILLKSNCPVFMFQNGLQPEVRFKKMLTEKGYENISNKVVGGVLMGYGNFDNDCIKYNFYDLKIGCWEDSEDYSPNVGKVLETLSGLDFEIESFDYKDYKKKRFEKSIYNHANSITAFFGFDKIIELLNYPYSKYSIEKKIEESETIAKMEGLNLENIMEKSMVVLTQKVPDHVSSMRQDFKNSPIVTEIKDLDLAFYQLGLEHGYAAEYNQLYGELVDCFSKIFNEHYKRDKEKSLKFKEEAIKNHKALLESESIKGADVLLKNLRGSYKLLTELSTYS